MPLLHSSGCDAPEGQKEPCSSISEQYREYQTPALYLTAGQTVMVDVDAALPQVYPAGHGWQTCSDVAPTTSEKVPATDVLFQDESGLCTTAE